MSEQGFRDWEHVSWWLEQFNKPEIATATGEVTIQMLAQMGQALQKVVGELMALKSIEARQVKESGGRWPRRQMPTKSVRIVV